MFSYPLLFWRFDRDQWRGFGLVHWFYNKHGFYRWGVRVGPFAVYGGIGNV